jgi:hypothetical protein
VAALAVGIAATAAEIIPNAGEQLRARLKTSTDPASQANSLAEDLAADLFDWPDEARLVIDDYHLLSESEAAEAFVEALVETSSVPVLIASRTRPSWVTAKKLLYGEVTELGRNVLAMTHEEAAQALSRTHEEMPGLVALRFSPLRFPPAVLKCPRHFTSISRKSSISVWVRRFAGISLSFRLLRPSMSS